MTRQLDNTTLWNQAAVTGAFLGALSIGCLVLKELAGQSGNTFLMTSGAIVLWAVEFFGCILIMKRRMLRMRSHFEGVRMEHTYKMGRRSALLSGLLLASAQALFIMQMPEGEMDAIMGQALQSFSLTGAQREQFDGFLDKLPLFTFIFQWLYCWLYGTVLASILSRYIFLQKLFGAAPPDFDSPDEQ